MPSSTVLITGAGFSSQADLPLQNGILREMVKKPDGYTLKNHFPESIKFLHSFIEVGKFLLSEYSSFDISAMNQIYNRLNRLFYSSDIVTDLQSKILNDIDQSSTLLTLGESEKESIFGLIKETINDSSEEFYFSEDEYYKALVSLKESIRGEIQTQKVDVNLEDLFTSFDKTSLAKEHIHSYTYAQMDSLKHAIMRLFVYYFGLKTSSHKFDNGDYLSVVNYVKQNQGSVSIITTNWDTVFEKYLQLENVSVNLCLSNEYYSFDDRRKNPRRGHSGLSFIKVHGSINWCKCLNCGGISIYEKKQFGNYLFDDNSYEKCEKCGKVSVDNSVLLQPEIITPTMIKALSGQLFANLWKTASDLLSRAQRIICITRLLSLHLFSQTN